jgi:hypothetical protein
MGHPSIPLGYAGYEMRATYPLRFASVGMRFAGFRLRSEFWQKACRAGLGLAAGG